MSEEEEIEYLNRVLQSLNDAMKRLTEADVNEAWAKMPGPSSNAQRDKRHAEIVEKTDQILDRVTELHKRIHARPR